MSENRYDVIVVGAGPGGYPAAIRAARLGAKVALIEADELGGTCLNTGCIPTKTLLATAAVLEHAMRSAEYGIVIEGQPTVNMAAAQKRKEKVISIQVRGIASLLKANGVQTIKGYGRLLSRGEVEIETNDGERRVISGENIILATGSRPVEIPGLEYDGRTILSSDHALSLSQVPASVTIIGAGVIGCEFAGIFSAFGARVEMVELLDRALATEDHDVSKLFEREIKKKKIKLRTGVKVERVRVTESGAVTELADGTAIETEKVLVSIGRKPNSVDLGLAQAGLSADPRGFIEINERLETGIGRIYAVGDLTGKVMLAHAATAQGVAAAENALGGKATVNYDAIPSAIFTHPEIGSIGPTEQHARESGLQISVGRFPFRGLGRAHAVGEIAGEAKLLADNEQGGRLIAAHIVGASATDLVAAAQVAIVSGMTAEKFGEIIFAHPTFAESLKEAAESIADRAIHLPPKK
jgi:dihydrolipoyl dehydrogenase